MSHLSKACLFIGFIEIFGVTTTAWAQKTTVSPAQALTPAQSTRQRQQFAKVDPKLLPKSPLDDQYQQRFAQYEQRIAQALTRGSLSQVEAGSYKNKLELLKRFEFLARKNSFEPERIAHLNKRINKFQAEFLKDENRPPAAKTEEVTPNKEAATPKPESAN